MLSRTARAAGCALCAVAVLITTPGTAQAELAGEAEAVERVLRTVERAYDRKVARRRARRAANRVATPPHLQAIAVCESGGDPAAVGGGGLYRGKYQFDRGTWAAVGGTGDPAAAPEAEQDARAAQLYAQRGSAPWPVCGG